MYLCIALAGHEIDAIETIYLNDVAVTLDVDGDVIEAPWSTSTTTTASTTSISGPFIDTPIPGSVVPEYEFQEIFGYVATGNYSYQYTNATSNVRITKYLGAAGQTADPDLIAAFPSDWTSANVVQGVAYLVVKLTYSEASFPSGAPNVSAVIRGAKLYDPRTGLTVWSENPALMMRTVYANSKFGKATVSATEDARFVAAANACDTATVYTVAGVAQPSCALYRAAIVLPFGTAPKSAFDDLTQAMGGSWAFAGGELYIKPGVYTASILSLTEADLAVVSGDTQSPIKISVHRERAQKFNSVKATIWDAAQDYKQVALTQLTGAALVTRDGATLVQEATFPAIGYAPQALHIAGVMMRDARDALTLEIPVKLRAYPLELFDTVDLTLTRYGWSAKTFMTVGRQWTSDGMILLTLKETAAAITQVDADFLAQGFATNSNLPKPWEIDALGAITVTSGTAELVTQADGTVTSRIRITWPQSTDQGVRDSGQIEVQYKLSNATAWESLAVPGNETTVATADVADGAYYLVRARAKKTLAVGDWGLQVQHQVIGKTEAPPAFDNFIVLSQPDGTRQYNFSYNSAAPADWLGAEIRYVSGTTATPDWDTMTVLQDTTTYYTNSPVELNSPLSGVYTFACKSVDTSGIKSAYQVVNITLPDRRLGNVFDEYYEGPEGWTGTLTGCHVQDGGLEANDSVTWATLAATWAGWTRWNTTPTSPITYVTPHRDFGTVIAGQVNPTVDADGTVLQELATSADGISWSAYGSATAAFSSRYIRLRLTVTATGPFPVPVVRSWSYQVNAPIRTEYLNDIVISALTGSYRIGTGDIRIPLSGVYTVIKRTNITIEDSTGGTWTSTRIDQSLSPAPRWQFRLNGTLTDPAFVDFFIEGY